MITPQQKGAWRRAYLRELRRIAESKTNPWIDEVEWEDELLEDRLTQFIYRDYLGFLRSVVFVFENHTLFLAELDSKLIKDEDAYSVSHLFQFLRSITSYGRWGVISKFDCAENIKQEMMLALNDGEEERFVDYTKNIDIRQICKSVGYVSSLMNILHLQIELMEHTEPTEEEEVHAKETIARIDNRSLGEKTVRHTMVEQLSIVKENGALRFEQLPSEVGFLQDVYSGIALQWLSFSVLVDDYFMQKEFSIIDAQLRTWRFSDISKDLIHLTSIIYPGYQYRRIVLPGQQK